MPVLSTKLHVVSKRMNTVHEVLLERMRSLSFNKKGDFNIKFGLMHRVKLLELKMNIEEILEECKDDEAL